MQEELQSKLPSIFTSCNCSLVLCFRKNTLVSAVSLEMSHTPKQPGEGLEIVHFWLDIRDPSSL